MFSSTKAAQACLKEYIDEDQIPNDYGGTGEDTATTLQKAMTDASGVDRMVTELMYIRSYQTLNLTIKKKNEELEINVHTRGVYVADFSITDSTSKESIIKEINVTHTGKDGSDSSDAAKMPTTVNLTADGRIKGPRSIRVKGSAGGMFGGENFLVVANFFEVE